MPKAICLQQQLNAIYRKEQFLNSRPTDPRKPLSPCGGPTPGGRAAFGCWGCSCLQISLPFLTAEQRLEGCKTLVTTVWARKFSAWCSAISGTCRTGNASEYEDRTCDCDGGGDQLPPTPNTTWTTFVLDHVALPKIFCSALDWILFTLFSQFNFSEWKSVKACAVSEHTMYPQTNRTCLF